ncbi:MAG: nucleoside permease [Paludibacteraceae bacterium]|nr:nucleoside permease [Paludibacteraceae bacterium]
MSIKFRLIILSFLQFFIWGAWLISFGGYAGGTLHFTGAQIGSFYATMGISATFMPALLGILADRFIGAEKLAGICHILGAAFLFLAARQTEYLPLYLCILGAVLVYMPTLSLSNSVAYFALETEGFNIVKDFPPIRVFGTIGFICAMWTIDLCGFAFKANQLYIASGAALLLGIYSFSLPRCPTNKIKYKSFVAALGLDAFVLFKQRKMAVFFLFSMLLGASLQITNSFGGSFLNSFKDVAQYADSFGVNHPVILLSVSQMSETLFILCIPFFLRRFGIKTVMLISMLAWFFRFGLFGLGNPGEGLWMLVLSMIVYGMAFDFFCISGSLFVEMETKVEIRSSAQGLFTMMVNGLGAIIGGYASGWVVDLFSTYSTTGQLLNRDWQSIWFTFATYALIICVTFAFVFKYKHDPKRVENFHH